MLHDYTQGCCLQNCKGAQAIFLGAQDKKNNLPWSILGVGEVEEGGGGGGLGAWGVGVSCGN